MLMFDSDGRDMTKKLRAKEYLAKAKDAEARAEKFAPGTFYNTTWLAIAEGYMALHDGEKTIVGASDGQFRSPV